MRPQGTIVACVRKGQVEGRGFFARNPHLFNARSQLIAWQKPGCKRRISATRSPGMAREKSRILDNVKPKKKRKAKKKPPIKMTRVKT